MTAALIDSKTGTGTASPVTVTMPTASSGDLVLAACFAMNLADPTPTPNTPSGYTFGGFFGDVDMAARDGTLGVFYKTVPGGGLAATEDFSYTGGSGSQNMLVSVSTWSGVGAFNYCTAASNIVANGLASGSGANDNQLTLSCVAFTSQPSVTYLNTFGDDESTLLTNLDGTIGKLYVRYMTQQSTGYLLSLSPNAGWCRVSVGFDEAAGSTGTGWGVNVLRY